MAARYLEDYGGPDVNSLGLVQLTHTIINLCDSLVVIIKLRCCIPVCGGYPVVTVAWLLVWGQSATVFLRNLDKLALWQ